MVGGRRRQQQQRAFLLLRLPCLLTLSSLSFMHSSQLGNGFFIFFIATKRLPRYSGRVVGCCIGLSSVPLGRGLLQSARHTVPNEPSPTSLMTVKSRGPSRMSDAAVVGMVDDEERSEVAFDSAAMLLADLSLLPYRGEGEDEEIDVDGPAAAVGPPCGSPDQIRPL